MPHYLLYTLSVLESVRHRIVRRKKKYLVEHSRQEIETYFNSLPKEPPVSKAFGKDY